MRGCKRRRAVMSISANRGQRRRVVLSGSHMAIELKFGLKIKPAPSSPQKRDDSLRFGGRGGLAFATRAIDAASLFVTFWSKRKESLMSRAEHA